MRNSRIPKPELNEHKKKYHEFYRDLNEIARQNIIIKEMTVKLKSRDETIEHLNCEVTRHKALFLMLKERIKIPMVPVSRYDIMVKK